MLDTPTENIRYLLWRAKLHRQYWPAQLAEWAGCTEQRAEELIRGASLQQREQESIARATGYSEEDLQFRRLVEEVNVLEENILQLLRGLEHGERKRLAEDLGVHQNTVSSWGRGRQRPTKHIQVLRERLQRPGVNLDRDALFLDLSPVTDAERKEWLYERIRQMDAGTLQELFPALERLLEDT